MSKYNYFSVITVDGYDFPVVPQANFNFISQGISFLNRGLHTLQYSFNGVNIHGDLNPADASKGVVFDARYEDKVWFKAIDGYGHVRVEAWRGS